MSRFVEGARSYPATLSHSQHFFKSSPRSLIAKIAFSRFCIAPAIATLAAFASSTHLSAAEGDQWIIGDEQTLAGPATYSGEGFPAGAPNPVYPDGEPGAGSAHRNALLIYNDGILSLLAGADLVVENDDNTAFLRVGYGVGYSGTLNISEGASLRVGQGSKYGNFHVGDGIGATGVVNQTGGNVRTIGSFNLGVNGGSGTYTISSGTLTLDREDEKGRTSLINLGFNQVEEEGVTSTGRLVIEGDARVEVLSPNRDDSTTGSIQLILGNRWEEGIAGDGIIDQTGGVLSIGEGANLYLSSYGNGVYNLSGGVLEIGGKSLQARYQSSTIDSTYEFNLSGEGGIKVVGSDLITSVDANVLGDAGIDTNGFNATWSGNLTGPGAFGKFGEGTLVFDGQSRTLREIAALGGNIRQSLGTTEVTEFIVGYGVGGSASYDLEGGDIVLSGMNASFRVGDYGGEGVFNQRGGTVTIGEKSSWNIGNQGGVGTYNLEGGVLNLNSGLHNLGRVENKPDWNPPYTPGEGVLNISGDSLLEVRNGGSLIIGGRIQTEPQGSGIVNQTGGTVRITNGTLFVAGYGDGTYNLNGGVLEVGGNSLRARYNNTKSNSTFNLGGGKVKVINSNLATSVDATLVADTTSSIDTNELDADWAGNIDGDGNLKKEGAGTLTLSGSNNSYTGTTEVVAGTLSVAAASRTGSGDVVIRQEATLSGSGVVAGFATIEGKLAPGNSPGKLTFEQGLTLGENSETTLEIAGQGPAGHDIIAVTDGIFTLGGALTLDITTTFEGSATFNLFDLGTEVDLLGAFSTVSVTGIYGAGIMDSDGAMWALTLNGSTSITFNAQDGTLNLEAIPEPGTWLLLGGGLAAVAVEWARRRKAA